MPVFTVLLVLALGVMGTLVFAGIRLRSWIGHFKDSITDTFKAALWDHEIAENKRFDEFDSGISRLNVHMEDVRERLARIEGQMEENLERRQR